MKGNNCEMELNIRDRNEKLIVTSIHFKMNERSETTYTATDPFRKSILKPMQIQVAADPVAFYIDQQAQKEIADFKRIHGSALSTGAEDIVSISYADPNIILEYGEGNGGHASSLILDTPVETSSKKKLGVVVQSTQLLAALAQSQDEDNNVLMQMTPKAIQLIGETNIAEHTITLVERTVRRD